MDLSPLQADLDNIYTGLFSYEATLADGSKIRIVHSRDDEIGYSDTDIQITVRTSEVASLENGNVMTIDKKSFEVFNTRHKSPLGLELVVTLHEVSNEG